MSEHSSLIPYLTVGDGRAAIDFYTAVFDASLIADEVHEMDDGRLGHASLLIDGHRLYLSDEHPEMNVLSPATRGGTTVAVVVNVADADATFARALEAGGVEERPVVNQFGQRSGWFRDPWGHRWSPTSPAKPDTD